MHRVLSIDPGTVNIGVSVIEFEPNQPPRVISVSVMKMIGSNRVIDFHRQITDLIRNVGNRPDKIVVERQIPMRSGYQCEIAVRMFAACESIPCDVVEPHMKYGIDRYRSYRIRKQQAIDIVSSLISDGQLTLTADVKRMWHHEKMDDIADSILQCIYKSSLV
jgi:hypothetical protein